MCRTHALSCAIWFCQPNLKSCIFWISAPLSLPSLYSCTFLQRVASHCAVPTLFLVEVAHCVISLAFLCYDYTVCVISVHSSMQWIIPVVYYVLILLWPFCVSLLSLSELYVPPAVHLRKHAEEQRARFNETECLNYGYCSNEKQQQF